MKYAALFLDQDNRPKVMSFGNVLAEVKREVEEFSEAQGWKTLAVMPVEDIREMAKQIKSNIGLYDADSKYVRDQIIWYLRQDKYIHAIKRCRELTGYGLKEAKYHVDDIRNYLHDRGNDFAYRIQKGGHRSKIKWTWHTDRGDGTSFCGKVYREEYSPTYDRYDQLPGEQKDCEVCKRLQRKAVFGK